MDIQSIRAFLKVNETGSFSRAAEALFITQPAVSKRISILEQSLGTALFDRIGKTVQLTAAGHALLPNYQRILEELNESQRIISNLRETTSGNLKVATSHHIGLHRLPPVLKQFSKSFPDVALELQFMDSEQATHLVLQGEIEIGIVTLPSQTDDRLSLNKIWSDPMHCVVACDHPLATNKNITKKYLLNEPSILPSHGTYTRALINTAFGMSDNLNILMETNYLETIKAMIKIGLGWGVIPDSMLDDSLSVLALKNLKMKRELGIVQHKARTNSSPANALLHLLNSKSPNAHKKTQQSD
jgi:DNA-binding transcriptional LysR family regulator